MDWKRILQNLWAGLGTTLFEISGTAVSVATLVAASGVMLLTFLLSRLISRAIRKAFAFRGVRDEGRVGVVTRLIHYLLVSVGFAVALETAGVQLSALFAAGAVFAVGLGFAMQNITQNFVSGVILLVERAIKPGDVLQVDGMVVKVTSMGIRSTVARTWDEEELIIPNSLLAQSTVKNFTMSDPLYRIGLVVGVVYSANMDLVLRVLIDACEALSWRKKNHAPRVLMREFGDSSVNFSVSVWIDDPWNSRVALSDLHFAVWNALKAKNITIAFPQLDVHFDSPARLELVPAESDKALP